MASYLGVLHVASISTKALKGGLLSLCIHLKLESNSCSVAVHAVSVSPQYLM